MNRRDTVVALLAWAALAAPLAKMPHALLVRADRVIE